MPRGNFSSCNFNLTLFDTIKPILSYPLNVNRYFDSNCEFIVPDFSSLITIVDNCDANTIINQTPLIGTVLTRDSLVTMTVTDSSGNSTNCSFTLSLFDTIRPSISCPSAITEYYNSNCEFVLNDYTLNTIFIDNCDSNITLNQFPSVGSTVNSDTTITISATDMSGNITNCDIFISLQDTIVPQLTCFSDTTEYFTSSCLFILEDYTNRFIFF